MLQIHWSTEKPKQENTRKWTFRAKQIGYLQLFRARIVEAYIRNGLNLMKEQPPHDAQTEHGEKKKNRAKNYGSILYICFREIWTQSTLDAEQWQIPMKTYYKHISIGSAQNVARK